MTPLMPQCDASRLMPGEAVDGLFVEGARIQSREDAAFVRSLRIHSRSGALRRCGAMNRRMAPAL